MDQVFKDAVDSMSVRGWSDLLRSGSWTQGELRMLRELGVRKDPRQVAAGTRVRTLLKRNEAAERMNLVAFAVRTVIDDYRRVLGNAADAPTIEQLSEATDGLAARWTSEVLRLTLAFVAAEGQAAAPHAVALLLRDPRLRLDAWADLQVDVGVRPEGAETVPTERPAGRLVAGDDSSLERALQELEARKGKALEALGRLETEVRAGRTPGLGGLKEVTGYVDRFSATRDALVAAFAALSVGGAGIEPGALEDITQLQHALELLHSAQRERTDRRAEHAQLSQLARLSVDNDLPPAAQRAAARVRELAASVTSTTLDGNDLRALQAVQQVLSAEPAERIAAALVAQEALGPELEALALPLAAGKATLVDAHHAAPGSPAVEAKPAEIDDQSPESAVPAAEPAVTAPKVDAQSSVPESVEPPIADAEPGAEARVAVDRAVTVADKAPDVEPETEVEVAGGPPPAGSAAPAGTAMPPGDLGVAGPPSEDAVGITQGGGGCDITEPLARLIDERRFGLAYWLGEVAGWTPQQTAVLRAAALADALTEATGACAREFRRAAESIALEDIGGERYLQKLSLGAAVRAQLLALWESGASDLVRRLQPAFADDPDIGPVVEALLTAAQSGVFLTPEVRPGAKARAELEEEHAAVLERIRDERTHWASRTLKYQRATAVWRAWTASDGMLGVAVESVASDDWSAVEDVERLVERFRDPVQLHHDLQQADRHLRGTGSRNDIEAGARERFIGFCREAGDLLAEWLSSVRALQASRKEVSGHLHEGLRKLRTSSATTLKEQLLHCVATTVWTCCEQRVRRLRHWSRTLPLCSLARPSPDTNPRPMSSSARTCSGPACFRWIGSNRCACQRWTSFCPPSMSPGIRRSRPAVRSATMP